MQGVKVAKFSSVFVLVVLGACGVEPERSPYAWNLPATPHAVLADGTTDARWTAEVAAARSAWSVPLVALGCDDPFDGAETEPVTLIAPDAWTIPSAIGQTVKTGIIIEGLVDKPSMFVNTVPHEFGHALGLWHVNPDVFPDSVMADPARVSVPSSQDVENAAWAIGCR